MAIGILGTVAEIGGTGRWVALDSDSVAALYFPLVLRAASPIVLCRIPRAVSFSCWDDKLNPACRRRSGVFSPGSFLEFVRLPTTLKALGSIVSAVDVRTAQPPNKDGAAIYNDPRWRRLLAEVIADRGRVCQDANHAHNRNHRLKNALPDPAILGRIYGDHIVELVDGGAPFDKSNVVLRCAVCHGRKTAREATIRRNTKYKQREAPASVETTNNSTNPPNTNPTTNLKLRFA